MGRDSVSLEFFGGTGGGDKCKCFLERKVGGFVSSLARDISGGGDETF